MRILWAVALLCLLALPNAAAHATVKNDDGTYWITTGNLNEPVTTWVKTGLDLSIRGVGDDDERVELEELHAHESVLATIVSPSGDEMDCSLRIQHGATNRYTCDAPYVLTEPGQYVVRLEGEIDGSSVDGDYNIAGPLPDMFERTFPATGLASLEDLQAENEELRQRISALEAAVGEGVHDEAASNGVPGLPPALLLGALAALAFLRRR